MKYRFSFVTAIFALSLLTLQAVTPALSTQQLQAVKADIAANGDLNANPNNEDGNLAIANLYNAAVPAFIVWKSMVKITEVGQAFDASELAARSTADNTRLQTLALFYGNGLNPALASNRAFFDDVFSGAGGVNTRAALLVLWKRPALRIEKLFATGTGTSVSPATLVIEGKITKDDILNARNSS